MKLILEPESFGAFLAYLSEEGRKNGHGSFSWADRSSYEAENVPNEVEQFLLYMTMGFQRSEREVIRTINCIVIMQLLIMH